MSIHDGHRQRMKERFMKHGLDTFNEHEVLELLLYYSIPRKNTNQIAHALINRFGSLRQVMEAPVEELKQIEGVGNTTAEFLSLLQQTHRRLNISLSKDKPVMSKITDIGDYMTSFFFGKHHEVVYLLCLDAKFMVIDCYEVCEGGVNSANISIRNIMDIAIRSNAVMVVLAHNHPGGLAVPSNADVQTTIQIAKALYMADITLLDHVIVAGEDYISMALSNLYDANRALLED